MDKPKIWGDVAKAAVPLSQCRTHDLTNPGAKFQTGESPSGLARTKDGFKEVIIKEDGTPAIPTFYVYGEKRLKTGVSEGRVWQGVDKSTPVRAARVGTIYQGTEVNEPAVYADTDSTPVSAPHYYLGHGRFMSFADSGFHHNQLYMPTANVYEDCYSYVDGSYTVYCSLAVYGLRTIADPATAPYSGFWSGITTAMTRLMPHYVGRFLDTPSSVGMMKWSTLGNYSSPYELSYVPCVMGTDSLNRGNFVYSTVYPTGSNLNGFPNTIGMLVSMRQDNNPTLTEGNSVTSSTYFDTPTLKFIGPAVSTSPGHAVAIFIEGTHAPRYFIEERRTSGGPTVYKHSVCNAYGLEHSVSDTETLNILDGAVVYEPNRPNQSPEAVLTIVAATTTNYGDSWSFTTLDPAEIFPDTLPYIKHSGSYSHEYWFNKSSYTTEENSALDALTLEQRIAGFYPYMRNVELTYTDYNALLLERSSMCVVGVDNLLWFLQTFKCAVIDGGGGNFSIDESLTDNYYLKNVLLQSTNGGTTWTRLTGFPESNATVFGTSYDTSVTDTEYDEMWRGEASFQPVCLREGVAVVKIIKWNRSAMGGEGDNHRPSYSPGTVMRPWKLYKTTNGGTSWSLVTPTGLPAYATSYNGAIGRMSVVKLKTGVTTLAVYALDNTEDKAALYTSTDDGSTWTKGASVAVKNFGGTFPYFPLDLDDNPYVGPDQMLNTNADCYGYSWPPVPGSFGNIMTTGERCEQPADIALPWRLDATVIP